MPLSQKLQPSVTINSLIHRQFVTRLIVLAAIATVLVYDVAPPQNRAANLDRVISGDGFGLARWLTGAALNKIGHELITPERGMTPAARVVLTRGWFADLARAQALEDRIAAAYTRAGSADPASATRALRAERDQLRVSIRARQDTVEAILQEQIEDVLREEGLALGGQVLPPLRMRLTRLPNILIISRRDRIEKIDQRELRTGLAVDDFDRIERAVERRFDVSGLVTPIGGYATYPTMLQETSNMAFAIGSAAHEWTHNYFVTRLSAVALYYSDDPEMRTINETAAEIVEGEVGARVLRRYYPDLAAELAHDPPGRAPVAARAADFDFNKEMRETRLQTDALLAQGRITEAEAYMEARRALFVAQGYGIRRLNQAWFAFYGAYNAEPGGAAAAGRDTTGPAVQALRARSPSLGAFIRAVAALPATGLSR